MDNRPILIVGCGDVGTGAAKLLTESGHKVFGLRRNVSELPDFIAPIAADITDPSSLACLQTMEFSQVIVATAAGEFSEQRYRSIYVDGLANVLQRLQARPPQRVILASSTSVYHQNDGSWVDEASETLPTGFSGRLLLEAEQLLLACGIPGTVVRFGGIYGPGRERLINRLRQGHIVAAGAQQYSNRIHNADCAGVLAYLVAQQESGAPLNDCYLAVDSAPTPLRKVCEWLTLAMGLDVSAMSEGASPMRGGNKRCNNQRLLDNGYQFLYPNYEAGFGAMLQGLKLSD
jgi:nucleoside-diphosphate-sugar epimerase